MAKVFWSNVPPAPVGARLWSPPMGSSSAVVLGDWLGLWLHWTGSRSVPCLGSDCPKSRHIRPGKWYGYLPIAIPTYAEGTNRKPTGWTAAVLALNNEQAYQVAPFLSEVPNVGLVLNRDKTRKAWDLESSKPIKPVQGLPKCPSVEQVVQRLFGVVPSSGALILPNANGETPPFSDQE